MNRAKAPVTSAIITASAATADSHGQKRPSSMNRGSAASPCRKNPCERRMSMPNWNEQQRRAVEIRDRQCARLCFCRQRQDDGPGRTAHGSRAQGRNQRRCDPGDDLHRSRCQRDEKAAVRHPCKTNGTPAATQRPAPFWIVRSPCCRTRRSPPSTPSVSPSCSLILISSAAVPVRWRPSPTTP